MRTTRLHLMALVILAALATAWAKDELIPTESKGGKRDKPPNPLTAVSEKMGAVARRIEQAKTGDETQDRQKAIFDKLGEMVEQARKQQQQSQQQQSQKRRPSPPKPQPKAQPKPKQGAGKKKTEQKKKSQPQPAPRPGMGRPGSGTAEGRLHTDAEEWGALPPAIRDQLLQTRGEGFPLKYRELLRRYYRTLAKPRE